MEDTRMTFGPYIAWARKKAGYNLRDLAALITKEDGGPISHQYLNDLENERRNPPSDHLIEELARVLSEHVPEVTAEILYFKARRIPPYFDPASISNGQQVRAAYKAMRRKLDVAA